MTSRQVAALAVRILALYCFVSALSNFGQAFIVVGYYLNLITPASRGLDYMFPLEYNLWSVVIAALPAILQTGFGVLWWMFADEIAVLVVPREEATCKVFFALDSLTSHVIILSTTGLLLISNSLPIVVQWVIEALIASRSPLIHIETNLQISQICAALVKAAFGLWLIFGGKGIVKTIRSARDIGRDPIMLNAPGESSES